MYREVLKLVAGHRALIDRRLLMGDFTFGGGGHSASLLESVPDLRVVGFDIDGDIIARAKEHYAEQIGDSRLALAHNNFARADEINPSRMFTNKRLGIKSKYDVCLIDLGFSQFNIASEKGFSYMSDE